MDTNANVSEPARSLHARIENRTATVGVIGLGYVGLPLAASAARAGFTVIGFDIDPRKPERLAAGRSYIDAVSSEEVAEHTASGRLQATTDFARLGECDVVTICVPTPLTKNRDPDLSFVVATAEAIAKTLRPGQLVVLESTTFPGTTDEIVRPILEKTGLRSGHEIFLGFSPEREDPGNATHRTASIPKVVAGDGADAAALVSAFYGAVVERIVPVGSTRTAEAVKLTENIFRAVNIALVNELKVVYADMGIDVWEVIDAAATKPFGFMPFYPGPGLGGHCIPIDPFYLTWKAREFGHATRFVELAGEVNVAMPDYVIARLAEGLDETLQKSLSASKVLVVGLAYKKNVSDVRESPSLRLIDILEARRVAVSYHDPHVEAVPPTRKHGPLEGRASVPLTAEALAAVDAVLIATDHDAVDYGLIAAHAPLIVDTRNAIRRRGLVPKGRLVLA
ncbi:nucleotide sugar dehydrogenase [Acuticoccus kandeliae]|uniref:nucleotide sugar dehydrogenase n=1 Tax=Acuticoccus kandeliae TaxID=2073160 RepID=UPI000D3EC0EB|nr:nucleotide sugar dehydrogenase [Acuticoccus kandeliae]